MINSLKMYKICDKVRRFIAEAMKNCKVELTAEVKSQRGIFQGDALSPLLLVIAMMPFNHTLKKFTWAINLQNRKRRLTTSCT